MTSRVLSRWFLNVSTAKL